MSVDSQRAGELFEQAAKLGPTERHAFLEAECGAKSELRQRVEEMLAAAETGSLESTELRAYISSRMEGIGDRIGRYKLLQKIGEGGCGVVYMAEQEEPVRRRVAVKVIKRGMDSRQVIARFEAERQALAMMDHPNIAKVLDAGETETGQPFFVMELVRGLPITEYCDKEKLRPDERLKLFVQICHAIQHAHQKGIIHRDIKPSNVLVAYQEGMPTPKVIDFGIAKAIEGRLTEKTLFTSFEQFMGTPAYMSPEQAEMSSLDIDTRSDIYSLGVLLYELLTGTTPFDSRELLAAGIAEIRRRIREEEPPRPSTRLSTLQEADLAVAALRRKTEPPKLVSTVRGDLDWIVMKALEKERLRRYETANGLAHDVERYLGNEAVSARPPGTIYYLQKLARRHKTAFAATVAVAVALIAGLCASLFMYGKERVARRQALEAKKSVEIESAKSQRMSERLALEMAESRFDSRDPQSALAYLAMTVRKNPTNQVAARRLISALSERTYLLPLWKASETNNEIADCEFDPQGKRLLFLTTKGNVRVVEAQTGKIVAVPFRVRPDSAQLLCGPKDCMLCIARSGVQAWDYVKGEPLSDFVEETRLGGLPVMNPNGNGACIIGLETTTLLNWENGRRRQFRLNATDCLYAAFSHNGDRLVTTSLLGGIQHWDAATGEQLRPPLRIPSSTFWEPSHDGQLIFARSSSGVPPSGLEIRDSQTGHLLFSPVAVESPGASLYVSDSGDKAAVFDHGRIRVINLRTGQSEPIQLEGIQGSGVKFSWSGNELFASAERRIEAWDLKTGQRLVEPRELSMPADITDPMISPDFQWAATISADRRDLWVWDCRFGKTLFIPVTHGEIISARLSPNETRILSWSGERVRISSFPGGETIRDFDHYGFSFSSPIKFSADGKEFFRTSSSAAWRWNVQNGEIGRMDLEGEPRLGGMTGISADGNYVAGRTLTDVRVWNSSTGKRIWESGGLRQLGKIEISPNDKYLLATGRAQLFTNTSARVFNLQTGNVELDLSEDLAIQDVSFSPSGDKLVALCSDQRARIYAVAGGRVIAESPAQPGKLTSVAVSADESRIFLAAGQLGRIWDTEMRHPLSQPMRHVGEVAEARFSQDGRVVVTVQERAVRVWDAETGEAVSESMLFKSRLLSIDLTKDGRWLSVVSGNEIYTRPLFSPASSTPEWLPTLAEAVGGAAIDEGDAFRMVAPDELLKLRKHFTQRPQTNDYGIWANWFFADRNNRPIYPGATKTVADYKAARLATATDDAMSDAACVGRADPQILATFARKIVADSSTRTNEASWLVARALLLEPEFPLAWLARAEVFETTGDLEAALRAIQKAENFTAQRELLVQVLQRKSLILQKGNRLAEAGAALSQAIAKAQPQWDDASRHTLLLARSTIRSELGDVAGARADFLLAKNIPERRNDEKLPSGTIDLTPYYTLGLRDGWKDRLDRRLDEESMQPGLHFIDNIPFDIRGRIQLGGGETKRKRLDLPDNISGILIKKSCRRLHFLHASIGDVEDDTRIGMYLIHFSDGQTQEVPLLFGVNIDDCEGRRPREGKRPPLKDAWRGERPNNWSLRAYLMTWTNSIPNVEITSIDYVSEMTESAPFVLGITAE